MFPCLLERTNKKKGKKKVRNYKGMKKKRPEECLIFFPCFLVCQKKKRKKLRLKPKRYKEESILGDRSNQETKRRKQFSHIPSLSSGYCFMHKIQLLLLPLVISQSFGVIQTYKYNNNNIFKRITIILNNMLACHLKAYINELMCISFDSCVSYFSLSSIGLIVVHFFKGKKLIIKGGEICQQGSEEGNLCHCYTAIARATVSLADDGLGPPTPQASPSPYLSFSCFLSFYQQPDNFPHFFSPQLGLFIIIIILTIFSFVINM